MATPVRILAPVAAGPGRGRSLQALVEVVEGLNVDFLRANPRTPWLYRSGVRYAPELPEERETFATIPAVLERRTGDCDDLAPWRSAELRVRCGVPAKAVVLQIRPGLWHVVVRVGNVFEDPSRALGMRGPA